MEREKFEESFKDAFQKAEVSPSDNVWTNIELDLERLQSGKMKKRVAFYQLVAAASVVFAMVMGGVGYYIFSTDDLRSGQLANNTGVVDNPSNISSDEQVNPLTNADDPFAAEEQALNNSSISESNNGSEKAFQENGLTNDSQTSSENANAKNAGTGIQNVTERSTRADAQSIASGINQTMLLPLSDNGVSNVTQTDMQSSHNVYSDRKLPAIVKPRKMDLHFPKTEPDKFDILLAQEMWSEKKKKQSAYEKVWTSVGFAAGTFNTNSTQPNFSALNAASGFTQNYSVSNTVSNEASASGVAYSIGVNVGGRISNRWVLQGGVNYMTQNSNYTSDAVITTDYQNYTLANSAEFSKIADASSTARVVNTSPYNVDNSLQFLSIPLQAGYLLVNNAFGLQLNGGISTDLFLQNTLTPESGTLNKVSNGRGSDSPYRPVNFSGLIGTELSYRFADRYRVSLNPGIRYPFNSIYKSELGLESNPITFDVGLRFRYIFQ